MLFDYKEYIRDERQSEEGEYVNEYENLVELIKDDLKQQQWYRNYVGKFKAVAYLAPPEIENDFDYDLLIRLAISSFSCSCKLIYTKEESLPELQVTVRNGDTIVTKVISELWSFQILRLYQIFIKEHMGLEILIAANDEESCEIIKSRENKLYLWNRRVSSITEGKLEGVASGKGLIPSDGSSFGEGSAAYYDSFNDGD